MPKGTSSRADSRSIISGRAATRVANASGSGVAGAAACLVIGVDLGGAVAVGEAGETVVVGLDVAVGSGVTEDLGAAVGVTTSAGVRWTLAAGTPDNSESSVRSAEQPKKTRPTTRTRVDRIAKVNLVLFVNNYRQDPQSCKVSSKITFFK